MEYLMFVCPLPKKSAGLCDYILNFVAQFHCLHYFSLVCSKTLANFFHCGTTMVIGGASYFPAGRYAADNLVLSKGITPNASIEAIKLLGST